LARENDTPKKRLRNLTAGADVGSVPRFTVMPMPRCWERLGNSPVDICGAPAGWARPARGALTRGFFCDRHKRDGDVPIAEGFIARRVTLRVEVLLAGTALGPAEAHVEAVERLMRVVEAAGGLLNLHDVSSTLGRYDPPAPSGGQKSLRGDR
jgi:hypothetical protein